MLAAAGPEHTSPERVTRERRACRRARRSGPDGPVIVTITLNRRTAVPAGDQTSPALNVALAPKGVPMSDVQETEREGLTRAPRPGARAKARVTRPNGVGRGLPRMADMTAMVGLVAALPINGEQAADRRRRLLAELCKVIGAHVTGGNGRSPSVADGFDLAPRLRQTLEFLVAGDSERQVALKLKISQHTVHVYVKQLYKRFGVNSRGELLARFVRGQS